MRRYRSLLLLALCAACTGAVGPWAAAKPPEDPIGALEPLDVHPRTSQTIVEQLRHNHYLDMDLDDETSSNIFANYLEMLDGARGYFTAQDIAEFEPYRHSLDDALKRGDLAPAFHMFNRHQQRTAQRFEKLLAQLQRGLDGFDFTMEESIELDRRGAPWLADEAALDELWRKRLKSAVLNMRLSGKADDEIQELLTKRYRNRLKQVRQTKSEDAFGLFVNALANAYDPHTSYFSPRSSQNFNINMSLSLQGIGAVLRSEDDYTSIVRLVPAGPADKSGKIRPADRIISVGQGRFGPLIDVVGWRLDDVVELIRGPKGSTVRLEIMPEESQEQISKIVQIQRNTVELEEQAAQKKVLTLGRGPVGRTLGVIEIPNFYVDFKAQKEGGRAYRSTTNDVQRLMEELKAEGIEGLVVDLRNNGGGSLQEADRLVGLFIKSGPTVQVKSARKSPNIYTDGDDHLAWDGPLVVLVNRLSASASEIFAGAVQDYGRGIVIGSRTFGKGTVQSLVPLNRGQLKITAAKFYRVSGQSTQHKGILPDIEFPEIYDVEHIGESSLDDAMPWDKITPAVYHRANDVQAALPYLRARHEDRVADNPDFVYLRALAQRISENNRKQHLSLNEQQRRQEKAEEDAWRLALENALRTAKGEPALASLDDLENEEPAAEEEDAEADATEDPMLVEAGEVLLDFIGFGRQVAMVDQPPVSATAPLDQASPVTAEAPN